MFKKSIILLLIILSIFSTQALAYTTSDIEWKESVASTSLGWGNSVTNGDYIIMAKDFSEDGHVSITISKNGDIIKFEPLKNGGILTAEDEIKIFVKKVNPNIDAWSGDMIDPTVSIQIFRRGLPDYEITIETDESTYDPKVLSSPKKITATIKVKNNGYAEVENVDLTIDTGNLVLIDGDLTYHYSSILKGTTTSPVTVEMEVPHLWDKTAFSISADTKGYDIKGAEYTGTKSKSVTIEKMWELIATKSITENIYMDETAYVLVSIRNVGIINLNSITATDLVVEGLELKDSVTLQKTISLKVGETTDKLFEYSLKPVKPGTYTSPAAVAEFTASNGKKYSISSSTPKIEVNGPYITLTKSVSSLNVAPGAEITVTVKVDNTGDRDASVTATDSLPNNVSLVSGDLGFQEVIKKSTSKSYSYVIRMDTEGDVKLPFATASFIDLEGYKGEKISNMPVISVVEPVTETDPITEGNTGGTAQTDDENNGDNPNPSLPIEEQTEPGFEGLFSILALVSIYMIFKRKN
ncbi:MAG: DUF11 domain-containing protein [Methanosarcinaceae archaeon]|nr:DUF11 domain-containing protein [Methanosarcinaceae archaeon]